MLRRAQRILEESEAGRAQAEAEFEIQLASRREGAERQEAERLAATQKLVTEAEQRAATAEGRAANASARADQTRREADQHSKQLVSHAKKNADQIAAQIAAHAKAQADQLVADTKTELERHRVAAQREVDELNRQKDAITTSLEQLRLLVSGQAPAIGPPAETTRPAAFE
jgi:hypothetical protein